MTTQVKSAVSAAMAKATKKGTLSGLKSADVSTILETLKPQIAQALPKASGLTPERIISISTTIITKNPKLAECSASSLLGAVLQASILGFKPVTELGECYFIPYGNSVQFQIGYKGFINLARRSGQLETIYAYEVNKGDVFDYELGLDPKLKHVPSGDGNELTHVYAVAKYKDGGFNFIVLNKSQIEALRKRNPMQKASPSGAWATDYAAMAKAKALKQLAKYMPLTDELASAIKSDEAIIENNAFTNDNSGLNSDAFSYEAQIEEAQIINEEPKEVNNLEDLFNSEKVTKNGK